MTPETAATRPPRKGPMLRQRRPDRRSGLMGVVAPTVSSAATHRTARAGERGDERWVRMAERCEVMREDTRCWAFWWKRTKASVAPWPRPARKPEEAYGVRVTEGVSARAPGPPPPCPGHH